MDEDSENGAIADVLSLLSLSILILAANIKPSFKAAMKKRERMRQTRLTSPLSPFNPSPFPFYSISSRKSFYPAFLVPVIKKGIMDPRIALPGVKSPFNTCVIHREFHGVKGG